MAQQESIIKLKGKIGDLSFFKTKDGYQTRAKGGVDGDRIKNDPSYQRTRENNAEFAEAAQASKKIRDVLREMILLTRDAKMATRLTSRVFKMIKADTVSLRGERKVKAESFSILRDFNFNEAAPLNNTLFVNMMANIDRASGLMELTIPSITPEVHLAKPKGATHFQISAGAALVSLDETLEESQLQMTATSQATVKTASPATVLSVNLPPATISPIIFVVSVSFYQEVNSAFYPMNNGAYNALCIVAIDIA